MKTTIKENVKKLLVRDEQTRDSETNLCYLYYINFCALEKSTSLLDFFFEMQNKEIPTMQTIMRYSRQLQEQNPDLRGKEWEKRQRKIKEVQKDLGYNVWN